MREMPAAAANLPDALVRMLPGALEEGQDLLERPPALVVACETAFAPLIDARQNLPIDVQLELS